jgi:uncharacterized protein
LKLHLDRFDGQNAFTGYGEGHVMINQRRHDRSLVVFPDRLVDPWTVRHPDDLTEESLAFLATEPLDVLLIGTGATMTLIHPRLYRQLAAARIGVEVMATPAACRTYNILLGESRKVAAALII